MRYFLNDLLISCNSARSLVYTSPLTCRVTGSALLSESTDKPHAVIRSFKLFIDILSDWHPQQRMFCFGAHLLFSENLNKEKVFRFLCFVPFYLILRDLWLREFFWFNFWFVR